MKRTILLLLIFLSYTISYAQSISYIYIKDISAATGFEPDFEQVTDNVNKKYTHLNAKGIDGIALKNKYMALVKNAKSNTEYGDILLRYFAELRNSHASAIFKRYYKNCSATLVENRVFISFVGDSTLTNYGVKEKDEIIRINNIPVLAYISDQEKYTAASTDLHRKYLTVSGLFSSYYKEDRTYTMKTSTGEKNIVLHFDDSPIQQKTTPQNQKNSNIEAKILNDSIAYIAITSMTGNVVNDFAKAFDTLSNKHSLIIDVRRNQGGNSGYSEKIAEYLITNKQTACVSNRSLNPKENHFKGKLFILTSPYTVSAAESFVLDLLESGNATIVGMPTAGDTGNQPQFYSSKLGYSYWFPSRSKGQISLKGFPMEGENIKPHYAISKSIIDYFADKDTILNYTLGLIQKKL